jgi:predicted glycosyltransferase
MRILIEVHHPSDIHFFKNPVRIWRERGHEVLVLGRDRDVMRALLQAFDWMPHRLLTTAGENNRFPVLEFAERQAKVLAAAVSFRPDVLVSLMGSYTQGASMLRAPNLVFTDSEHQAFNHRIAHPFATRIYTPECFWKDLGPKQVRYRGYHELAYLHPSRFEPDERALELLGHDPGSYIVLRTSAWNTLHDVGQAGLGSTLDEFVERAQRHGPVVIVPEGRSLPERWEHLRLRVPPHRFHDVLAFAKLVVTEGASTASECACLGVRAVYVNSIELGYLKEQADRYGLIHDFRHPEPALAHTLRLLESGASASDLREARARLVDEHIDVTRFVADEVERRAT